jgi:hypothetical protein
MDAAFGAAQMDDQLAKLGLVARALGTLRPAHVSLAESSRDIQDKWPIMTIDVSCICLAKSNAALFDRPHLRIEDVRIRN